MTSSRRTFRFLSVGALTLLWDNLLKTHADKNLKVRREEVMGIW